MKCDKERLVGYLYDDLPASERRQFETHLEACPACFEEVAGLRSTRTQLEQWVPPEPALAFQIVRGGAAPAVPERRVWVSPLWGLAAAAVLVLAAAAAIANVEVKYGNDGLTVRTGWAGAQAAPLQPATPLTPVAASESWKADLAALERRLRDLESASTTRPQTVPVQAQIPRASDDEILRRVQRILVESERRQRDELALRIGQMLRDVEATRRADLAHIQQGFAQVQGLTDTTLLRQRQMEQNLYRVGVVQQK
jgi:Putative zinc-finger